MKIYKDEKEVATLTEKGITTADEGLQNLYKAACETGLTVLRGKTVGGMAVDWRVPVCPPSRQFMGAFARVLCHRGYKIEF